MHCTHRGYSKTNSLKELNFYWPNLKREVKDFNNSCIKYQESKASNRKIGERRPFSFGREWVVYIDGLYTQIAIN